MQRVGVVASSAAASCCASKNSRAHNNGRARRRGQARGDPRCAPATRAPRRASPIFARAGDEDTVTGFLLAGVGHRTADKTNFLVVKGDTPVSAVEAAFNDFTTRDDIGIVLINQHARGRRRARRRRRPETAPPPAGRERHPTSAQVVHENDPDRARDAVQGSALRPAAGLHHAARERHAQRRDVGGPRPVLSRC